MKRMRVVIDVVPLLLRSAGVKTHVYEWVSQLRRLAGPDAVGMFPFVRSLGRCEHERSMLPAAQTAARLAFLAAVNYSGLPILDWSGIRGDIFHASQQTWNPPSRVRLTATIYDMTCWVVPETHPHWNISGAKRYAERVVKRATGLIANSESAKSDAVRILGLPDQSIDVIYPGVAERFFGVTEAQAREAAAKFSLARPYVLFVGTIEPRKNVDTLLDAWSQVSESVREEFDLVLAGPAGWAPAKTIRRLRAGAHGVRYLGYVPEEDLPGLTAGATAFVYPSLYEGFGLPAAQAMAAGVPVVTSNVSSMPEVAGDAGLLADPRSAAEIRSAMERLLLSADLRTKLAARGIERSRQFNWEDYARRSLAFFERICGQ